MSSERAKERAIALARARKRKAESEEGGSPLAFANKAIGETIGAPIDITNAVLGALGLPVSERPFLGGESIKSGMRAAGIDIPTREPMATGEYVGQTFGEAASMMLPMGLGIRALSAAKGVIGGVSRKLLEDVAMRPWLTGIAEAGGATGVGIAREFSEREGLSPSQQMFAELGGGIIGSLTTTGLIGSFTALPKAVINYTKQSLFPFTEIGATERASARLLRLVKNPDQAMARIDDLKGSNLLPSARTEEPGLMALEAVVLKNDPVLMQEYSERASQAIQKLAQEIRGSGNVKNSRDFVFRKRERLKAAIDARAEVAAEDARKSLEILDSQMTPADASIIVRDQLESAYADAKVQESELWQSVPQDAQVPTKKFVETHNAILESIPLAQRDDFPTIATQVIEQRMVKRADGAKAVPLYDKYGNVIGGGQLPQKDILKSTTVAEFDGLYKKLGDIQREARAAGQNNRARIAGKLRESILNSYADASGNPDTIQAIQIAREHSLSLNKKFNSGNIGRILGYQRDGGVSTPESLTLEMTIGKRGQKGRVALEELRYATEDDPTALEGVQNYLKARFIRDATRDGRVLPAQADTFMRQYTEIIDAFPALKDQLRAAKSSEDVFRRVTKSSDARRKALDRKEVSISARFLNANVDDTMASIMSLPDPKVGMRELVKLTSENKLAAQGIKVGMGEWLIKQATSPVSTDISGRPLINGIKLQNVFNRDSVQSTLKELYSPDELKGIENSVKQLALFEKQARIKPSGILLDDQPQAMLTVIARVIGAKTGSFISRATGGQGNIQIPGIFSNASQKFLRNLTVNRAEQLLQDAVLDENIMKMLLAKVPRDKRAAAQYNRKWNEYFRDKGARLLVSGYGASAGVEFVEGSIEEE